METFQTAYDPPSLSESNFAIFFGKLDQKSPSEGPKSDTIFGLKITHTHPFGAFPKNHRFWWRHPSLTLYNEHHKAAIFWPNKLQKNQHKRKIKRCTIYIGSFQYPQRVHMTQDQIRLVQFTSAKIPACFNTAVEMMQFYKIDIPSI